MTKFDARELRTYNPQGTSDMETYTPTTTNNTTQAPTPLLSLDVSAGRTTHSATTTSNNTNQLTLPSQENSVVHQQIREDILPTWRLARKWQTTADKSDSRSRLLRRLATTGNLPDWSYGQGVIPGLTNLDQRALDDLSKALTRQAHSLLTELADILLKFQRRCTTQANASTHTLETLLADDPQYLRQVLCQLSDVTRHDQQLLESTLRERETSIQRTPSIAMDHTLRKLGLFDQVSNHQGQNFPPRRGRSPKPGTSPRPHRDNITYGRSRSPNMRNRSPNRNNRNKNPNMQGRNQQQQRSPQSNPQHLRQQSGRRTNGNTNNLNPQEQRELLNLLRKM